MLQAAEDSELVRRRGRWVSHKVMEIYLQEVAASSFVADLPAGSRHGVQKTAELFESTLRKAHLWWSAGVPFLHLDLSLATPWAIWDLRVRNLAVMPFSTVARGRRASS